MFVIGFLCVVGASFALVPFLGRNFFPAVDAGNILMHVRTQVGTRVEETANQLADVQKAIRKLIPGEIETLTDNIGMPISGINMTYNNTGVIGPQDGDIQIKLKEGHKPTEEHVRVLREQLPRLFPGVSFAFLPADIVSQILNFGAPAPIDLQIRGANHRRQLRLRQQAAGEDPADSRRCRCAHPAVAEQPDLQHRCRPHPRAICRPDRARRHQQPRGQSRRLLAGRADLLSQSGQRRVLLDRDADAAIPDRLAQRAADAADHRRPATRSRRSSAASPTSSARPRARWCRNTTSSRWCRSLPRPQGRDLGAVAADIRQVIADTAKDVPKGSSVVLLGQVQTMNSAFTGLLFGLLGAVVLIYFLIVVNFQSWSDPFVIITALPAALAGIVWMLFTTETTLSVPALTGAIMCMGVATANSVLVICFARERYEELGDPVAAALEAGFVRFRPVLMTALAMIIGMAPMALGLGRGRRAECAARPRRDRRPDLCNVRHADVCSRGVQYGTQETRRQSRRPIGDSACRPLNRARRCRAGNWASSAWWR